MSQASAPSYYAPPYGIPVAASVEEEEAPQGAPPMGTWAAVGIIVVLGVAVAALFIAIANAKQIDASPQADMVANIEDLMNRDAQVLQQDILAMQAKSQAAQAALQKELSALRAAHSVASSKHSSASKAASSKKKAGSAASKSVAAASDSKALFHQLWAPTGAHFRPAPIASLIKKPSEAVLSEKKKKVFERAQIAVNANAGGKATSAADMLQKNVEFERAIVERQRRKVKRSQAQAYRLRNDNPVPDPKTKALLDRQAQHAKTHQMFPRAKGLAR